MSGPEKLIAPAAAAGVGAGVGSAAVAASGMTAAGMVGGGAGFGAAAGPVGMFVGALAGLAVYGIARAVGDVFSEDVVIVHDAPDPDEFFEALRDWQPGQPFRYYDL